MKNMLVHNMFKIVVFILMSDIICKEMYVDRQDKDVIYGFGKCDSSSNYVHNGGCKCNSKTFFMESRPTKKCYSDKELKEIAGCSKLFITDSSKSLNASIYPSQCPTNRIDKIDVWDASTSDNGDWSDEWHNELSSLITLHNNELKFLFKDRNFTGLLIRIRLSCPKDDCILLKYKGKRNYPLGNSPITKLATTPAMTTTPTTKAATTKAATTTTTTTQSATTTTIVVTTTTPQTTTTLAQTTVHGSTVKLNLTSDPNNRKRKSDSSSNTPVIVGSVSGLIILIILIIIFVIIRKRRSTKPNKENIELKDGQPIYAEYDATLSNKEQTNQIYFNSTTVNTKTNTNVEDDYTYAYNNPVDLYFTPNNGEKDESEYIYVDNTNNALHASQNNINISGNITENEPKNNISETESHIAHDSKNVSNGANNNRQESEYYSPVVTENTTDDKNILSMYTQVEKKNKI